MMRIGLVGDHEANALIELQINKNTQLELVSTKAPSANFHGEGKSLWQAYLSTCDALILTEPVYLQYDFLESVLKEGKHLLMDFPITLSLDDVKSLRSIAKEGNVKCMISNTERYNPALDQLNDKINHPIFIETHRLKAITDTHSHIDVIKDMMLKDIDLAMSVVKSEIKRISATGVKVMNDSIDIANARLEFSNGCIANLNTSRIAGKNLSKMRIFQKDSYYVLNFDEPKQDFVQLDKFPNEVAPKLRVESKQFEAETIWKNQIKAFSEGILHQASMDASLDNTVKAMEVADKILQKVYLMRED